MICFCADDYGLSEIASIRIQQCVDAGVLNKVSVFPNFDRVDLSKINEKRQVRISLHLNLVEGKCMANADEIDLIAGKKGDLKHTFCGLLKLNLLQRKKFEVQVYKEVRAQILFWKNLLPEGYPFCIDTHQHTSMIPAVFKALLKVLKEEKIDIHHIRIPVEPLLPYITTPSLYFTYNPVNIVKQWLLNFLWLINKTQLKKNKLPTAYFFGILFSGEMDEKRVRKILPKYLKLAEKSGKDVEVLFHPGYLENESPDFKEKNIVFKHFYLSENRKKEFDSVMKFSERSVM